MHMVQELSPTATPLGIAIRQRRLRQGWSVTQLAGALRAAARQIGCRAPSVSDLALCVERWERCVRTPTAVQLMLLSVAMDLPEWSPQLDPRR